MQSQERVKEPIDIKAFNARMERLECQHHRLKWVTLVAGFVLGAGLLLSIGIGAQFDRSGVALVVGMGLMLLAGVGLLWPATLEAQPTCRVAVAEVVRTQRVEIMDNEGRHRAVLSVGPDSSPALVLWGKDVKTRAMLRVLDDGRTGLYLWGKGGESSASLSVRPDGRMALVFWDKNGVERAALGILEDGTPSLTLCDPEGKPIWSVPEPSGAGSGQSRA